MSSNDPNVVPETEVEAGFQAMLNELKVNSRPHLTTLTILAGEYRQFARQIVTLIENQLTRVKRYRLPIMYLIDSIIKEFPEEYVPIFSRNLVQIFADTFIVTVDQRSKLYTLRTTWDNIFEAKILYDLDIKIKTIDHNWPVRVRNNQNREAAASSSDEFSDDSRSDDAVDKRASKSDRSNEPVLTSGQTGGTIKAIKDAMTHTLVNTPNSTRSTAENSPKRKSRPPSNVGTSPRSSIDGRVHRIQSLDERVSSLSGSRNHSDASDTSFDNANLFIDVDANLAINSPHNSKNANRFRDFVPPNATARFDSPVGRSNRGSLPGSTVSSPRNSICRGVESIPIGQNKVEACVQVKPVTTTRLVQTGHFTKTAETMTEVAKRDVSTQKKLRKPKQVHFTQQFLGPGKRTIFVQTEISGQKSVGVQWKEKDQASAAKIDEKFSKKFEFRNAVASFQSVNCSRMADSILRRLHEHQKQNEFCDLTISLGSEFEKVRCHKYIVAMVSDVIQSESVMKDEIIFTNIKLSILQELIDYCYTQMIGPFVNRQHVADICDGIKKLQIRLLEPAISQIESGLATGVDYCGAAISGMELITADVVTAAMLGQALPQPPMSSIGLSDLQENGLNNLIMADEMDSEEEIDNEEVSVEQTQETPKKIKLEVETKKSEKAKIRRNPPKRVSKLPKVVSCGSSSDSEAEVVVTPKRTPVRNRNKPNDTEEVTPVVRSRKKNTIVDRSETPDTPKVPKKRKKSEVVQNGTPKSTKRPRRRTNEGVSGSQKQQTVKSVLDSISPTHDSPKASPRHTPRRTNQIRESETNQNEIDDPYSSNHIEKVQSLTIAVKTLSKKAVEKALNELSSDEEIDDDRVKVELEEQQKTEPGTEQTINTGTHRARRKTIATVKPETPKEIKTPKMRRKSIQISPSNPICPWESDERTQNLLNMRDSDGRERFYSETGHRLQCTFIAEIVEDIKKSEN